MFDVEDLLPIQRHDGALEHQMDLLIEEERDCLEAAVVGDLPQGHPFEGFARDSV